jgi:hypothetical protein
MLTGGTNCTVRERATDRRVRTTRRTVLVRRAARCTVGAGGGLGLTILTNSTAVLVTRLTTCPRTSPSGPPTGTVKKATTCMMREPKTADLKPR